VPGREIWKKKGTQFKDKEFVITKRDFTKKHVETLKYLLSEDSLYNIIYENDDFLILSKISTD
jgi:hypothetical protein